MVSIQSPASSDSIAVSSVHLAGSVSDNTGVRKIEYRVADAGWMKLDPSSQSLFSAEVPLPSVDGTPLDISVRATDEFGAETVAMVHPFVDTRSPTFSISPKNDSRATSFQTVVVSFSEAVNPSTGTITVTPDAGVGSWDVERRVLTFGLMRPGTKYSVVVATNAVQDSLGNRNADAGTSVFYTQAARPPAGVFLNSESILGFDVAQDEDGVVTVVTRSTTSGVKTFVWGQFSPTSGNFAVLNTLTDSSSDVFRAVAYSEAVDFSPKRRTGFWKVPASDPSAGSAYWNVDGAPSNRAGDVVGLMPTPPHCAQGQEDSMGFVLQGGGVVNYHRDGVTDISLQFVPQAVLPLHRDTWQMVGVSTGSVAIHTYAATKCSDSRVPSFDVYQSQKVASSPRFSAARTVDLQGLMIVFDDDHGTRTESCIRCTDGASCSEPVLRASPLAEDFQVASANEGGILLGARKRNGKIELLKKDFAEGCASDWTRVADVDGAAYSAFRPVMFSHTPGLIVQEGNALRVVYP